MPVDLYCPIEPRSYEIQVNKQKELTYCAIEFYNLSQKTVVSVEFILYCYNSFG